ncbi:hypothetical protein SMICM17S_08928 [Streptomyces microflavus]
MRRPVVRRLQAQPVAALALAAATGVVLTSAPAASAATGSATGYATQNGGTTGGAGGQTVGPHQDPVRGSTGGQLQ